MVFMRTEFLKSQYFILLIFLVVGFAVYANSFVVPFFWDDNDNVVNNIYVTSWKYLSKYFSENLIAGSGLLSNYWRPFLLMSYSIDYHFFGLDKYWWHFVNISLHILNAFLIFLLIEFLAKNKWFAFLVSLIFLVHPVQTEAITMITARADPLFLFLILTSFFFYVKDKYPIGRIFLFILALLTKETAIILPALLILTEICFPKEGSPFKRVLLKIAPFLVLVGVYFLARLTILNFNNTLNFYNDNSAFASSILIRSLSFLKALSIYYSLLIFPFNLHMERFFEPIASMSFFLALILMTSIGVVVFSFWRRKSNSLYLFGIGWFFIALAPVSNILIPINRIIYEHWLYAPLVGFFIFFIALWDEITARFKEKYAWISNLRLGLLFSSVIIITLFCWLTINRNSDWRNPIIFFNNILKYNNKSLLAWNNLGMAYADDNNFNKAKEAYRQAIALDVKNQSAPPHHNVGNIYKAEGRFKEAIEEYEKAISIDKKFFFSYNALLDLYLKINNQKAYSRILERVKNL